MKRHDGVLTFAGFLGLAVITAHIINWSIGESYAFYTYPAMWLLALVILAIALPRQDADTAQVQQKTATATETATTRKP